MARRIRHNKSSSKVQAAAARVGAAKRRKAVGLTVAAACVAAAGLCLLPTARTLFSKGPGEDASCETSQWEHLRRFRVTPEYDRRLKRVVISLANADFSLRLQHELLARLPDYTQIILLLPAGKVQAVSADLADRPYRDRVRLVTFEAELLDDTSVFLLFRDRSKLVQVDMTDNPTTGQHGTLWAQDLFEVATDPDGQVHLLASCVHKYYYSAGGSNSQVVRDNVYLDRLSATGVKVTYLPLAFKGGNVLVDKIGGQWIAFCGPDLFVTTRTAWRAVIGSDPTDEKIRAILRSALRVDRVVVPGAGRLQPDLMYHLDQCMLLLHDGAVAVPRIVGPRPKDPTRAGDLAQAERFLTELRACLSGLGYRVIDIHTPQHRCVQFSRLRGSHRPHAGRYTKRRHPLPAQRAGVAGSEAGRGSI